MTMLSSAHTTARRSCFILAASLALVGCSDGDDPTPTTDPPAGVDPQTFLDEKAGTYTGSWEMFGLDAADMPVSAFTWTDIATTSSPTITTERAFFHVTDEMAMSNGMSFTQAWIEGAFIEADGTIGEEFFEIDGEVSVMTEIEPDRYQYETAMVDADFFSYQNINPDNFIEGVHLTDKRVTYPDGIETHHITRTTTLQYQGSDGPVSVEFVSLQGMHQKQP